MEGSKRDSRDQKGILQQLCGVTLRSFNIRDCFEHVFGSGLSLTASWNPVLSFAGKFTP